MYEIIQMLDDSGDYDFYQLYFKILLIAIEELGILQLSCMLS